MKKPAPVNKEVPFGFDELFFSTTDERGVIEYGNEVFLRISGYSPDKILGAPHSIIRHPDMPKCVFKVFWSILKSNSPVGAFVKNLASDGSYYWVFAFAFPVNDGYLSIRFKPSSALFQLVQNLYADALKKEKASSMDEAEIFLLENLSKLGFGSYEDFMVKATVMELHSHETHFSKISVDGSGGDSTLKRMTEIRNITSVSLNKSFSKVDFFVESSKFFNDKIHFLNNEFKKLKFLSMNMNITAANIGENAATLSTISEEFARLAGQIENQMKIFSRFTNELTTIIKNCSLNLSALKAQMNMVDFFLKESMSNQTGDGFDGMVRNKDVFTSLFLQSVTALTSELHKLKTELDLISGQIFEIQKVINGLQIIKQTGSIESARNDDLKSSFTVYLQEMTVFIGLLRSSIAELNSTRDEISKSTSEVQNSSAGIKNNISELFALALKKKAC